MTHPLSLGINVADVAKAQVLHAPGERLLAGPQDTVNVIVIGHAAEGMDPIALPAHALGEPVAELDAVLGREDDVLPGFAPQDDFIEDIGDVKGRASHRARVP